MTAIREQIFAAIDARLSAIAGVEQYERMPSGDPTRFNALFVFDDGDVPAEDGEEAGTTRKRLSVGVDGYVKGGTGAAAHAAAHALYAAVIEALFPEPVLDGLADEIEELGLKFTVAERANERRIAFSLDLGIHYATRRGSPQVIE